MLSCSVCLHDLMFIIKYLFIFQALCIQHNYFLLYIDNLKRSEHDKILNRHHGHNNYHRRTTSSSPPPNYRKVYTTQPPPPNFKTFNAKYHYDMHYGDGMMKEEIERARKRAEQASSRNQNMFGYEYRSPLGRGFEFDTNGGNGNPFSRYGGGGRNNKKKRGSRYNNDNHDTYDEYEFEYEEGYMDMGASSTTGGGFGSRNNNNNHHHTTNSNNTTFIYKSKGREIISERMKERRKYRKRNRGDPLYQSGSTKNNDNDDATSCVIM